MRLSGICEFIVKWAAKGTVGFHAYFYGLLEREMRVLEITENRTTIFAEGLLGQD